MWWQPIRGNVDHCLLLMCNCMLWQAVKGTVQSYVRFCSAQANSFWDKTLATHTQHLCWNVKGMIILTSKVYEGHVPGRIAYLERLASHDIATGSELCVCSSWCAGMQFPEPQPPHHPTLSVASALCTVSPNADTPASMLALNCYKLPSFYSHTHSTKMTLLIGIAGWQNCILTYTWYLQAESDTCHSTVTTLNMLARLAAKPSDYVHTSAISFTHIPSVCTLHCVSAEDRPARAPAMYPWSGLLAFAWFWSTSIHSFSSHAWSTPSCCSGAYTTTACQLL